MTHLLTQVHNCPIFRQFLSGHQKISYSVSLIAALAALENHRWPTIPHPLRDGARREMRRGRGGRKSSERREVYFDLLASGYSHQQIAAAMEVSVAAVRREIEGAIVERRLDAPDRYIHVQVARLTKALRAADEFDRARGPEGGCAVRQARGRARPLSWARRQIQAGAAGGARAAAPVYPLAPARPHARRDALGRSPAARRRCCGKRRLRC